MVTKNKTGQIVLNIIFILLAVWAVAPFLLLISSSLSSEAALAQYGYGFWPKEFSLNAYTYLFKSSMKIAKGYGITLIVTLVGTTLSVLITTMFAYPLSRKGFLLKKPIMLFIIFTMFFSGGMVPTFLVVQKLGLTNTIWAMIIPGMLSVYNMIVLRTSFESVPESLYESAALDGANHFTMLTKITLPLSKAALATITLFYAVGKWGEWYNALVYLQKRRDLYPLQMFLRELLVKQEDMDALLSSSVGVAADSVLLQEIIKYATIIVTTVPILLVYPFLQKYFVKGVLVGSVKE